MRDNRRNRSHTKKGPGRYHGQGTMITIRPMLTDIRIVRPPQQRLKLAQGGVPGYYMTYAEHDRIQAFRLDCRARGIEMPYEAARDRLIEERNARIAGTPTTERLVTIPLEG